MIKVLWLCNIVMPELCEEFGFKITNMGGWLTGMWKEMKKISQLQLGVCLPIYKKEKMKDGMWENYHYYSFHCVGDENLLEELTLRFCEIIDLFQPDVIHVWGTEYMHSLAMILAAERKGILEKVVVNIQGILKVYALHYANDLPYEVVEKNVEGLSIRDRINEFRDRSRFELLCLEKVQRVIGRTTWDRASVLQMNPKLQYYFCNEILRPTFYKNIGTWKYEDCEKNTIFISQASYPIKGFHLFLKGLHIVKQCYPNVRVYVAGHKLIAETDAYAEYIFKQIEEYGLEENIEFLGLLTEIQMCEYLKKCNVFVSASAIENSPNSVCEAAIIGCPIVASNVGGVSNLLIDKREAYLYPYNEFYMLAYYISEIFKNENAICQKFSRLATLKMQAINNIEINSKKTLQIYEEITMKFL